MQESGSLEFGKKIADVFIAYVHPKVVSLEGVVFFKDVAVWDESLAPETPFLIKDNKLGMTYWSIPPLLEYLTNSIGNLQKKNDIQSQQQLKEFTRDVLLLNADHYSMWNLRKQFFLAKTVSLSEELHLTKLTLTKHPKSDQIFTHKRFLIQQILKNPPKNLSELLQDELEQSWKACLKYKRNYYSWTYRGWLLQYLTTDQVPDIFN